MGSLAFWTRYLKTLSIFLSAMGLMWAFTGNFDPFGLYETQMARAFFSRDVLPEEAARVFKFILGPFGTTSAAYFVLQYFIADKAFAKAERWAYWAIMLAFYGWFVLDTIMSLIHGAGFNVLMANLPSILLMLPVTIFAKRFF